jgi:hypothetical protein
MMGFYLVKTKEMTLSALAGAISLLSGVGVIALFHFIDPAHSAPARNYWYYPVGLLAGMVFAVRGLFDAGETEEPPSNSN